MFLSAVIRAEACFTASSQTPRDLLEPLLDRSPLGLDDQILLQIESLRPNKGIQTKDHLDMTSLDKGLVRLEG